MKSLHWRQRGEKVHFLSVVNWMFNLSPHTCCFYHKRKLSSKYLVFSRQFSCLPPLANEICIVRVCLNFVTTLGVEIPRRWVIIALFLSPLFGYTSYIIITKKGALNILAGRKNTVLFSSWRNFHFTPNFKTTPEYYSSTSIFWQKSKKNWQKNSGFAKIGLVEKNRTEARFLKNLITRGCT